MLAVNRDRDAPAARWLALVGAVAGFVVTIPLYLHFTLGTAEMQFVETIEWIPRFNINYLLGVDGISVLFILLNSFITMLAVWAGWVVIEKKVAQYMAAFLIMSGFVNGVFAALDAVLFYTFFEAQLIPMYLIIGIWGGPNRIYAALWGEAVRSGAVSERRYDHYSLLRTFEEALGLGTLGARDATAAPIDDVWR